MDMCADMHVGHAYYYAPRGPDKIERAGESDEAKDACCNSSWKSGAEPAAAGDRC